MNETPADRLRRARIDKGYATAEAAADAYGWKRPTYHSHENASRNLTRKAAERYAAAFQVSAEWLLTGKGYLTPPELAALEWARALPPDKLRLWLDMAAAMAPENGRKAG